MKDILSEIADFFMGIIKCLQNSKFFYVKHSYVATKDTIRKLQLELKSKNTTDEKISLQTQTPNIQKSNEDFKITIEERIKENPEEKKVIELLSLCID